MSKSLLLPCWNCAGYLNIIVNAGPTRPRLLKRRPPPDPTRLDPPTAPAEPPKPNISPLRVTVAVIVHCPGHPTAPSDRSCLHDMLSYYFWVTTNPSHPSSTAAPAISHTTTPRNAARCVEEPALVLKSGITPTCWSANTKRLHVSGPEADRTGLPVSGFDIR